MTTCGSRDWRYGRLTDLSLRLAGLVAAAGAGGSIHTLVRLQAAAPHSTPTVLAYLLATLTFLAASVGSMLVTLGCHVFDQIEISERWARNAPPRRLPSRHVR